MNSSDQQTLLTIKVSLKNLQNELVKANKKITALNEKVEGYASACATLLSHMHDLKDIKGGTTLPIENAADTGFMVRASKHANVLFAEIRKRRSQPSR